MTGSSIDLLPESVLLDLRAKCRSQIPFREIADWLASSHACRVSISALSRWWRMEIPSTQVGPRAPRRARRPQSPLDTLPREICLELDQKLSSTATYAEIRQWLRTACAVIVSLKALSDYRTRRFRALAENIAAVAPSVSLGGAAQILKAILIERENCAMHAGRVDGLIYALSLVASNHVELCGTVGIPAVEVRDCLSRVLGQIGEASTVT